MKFIWSVPALICCLLAAAGILMLANSLVPAPPVLASDLPARADSKDAASSANLTGTWQLTWNAESGTDRQASMQLKQNRSRLSGKFQGERGSASLSGTLDGDQVSFSVKMRRREVSFSGTVSGDTMSGTTARGSWTATREQQQ